MQSTQGKQTTQSPCVIRKVIHCLKGQRRKLQARRTAHMKHAFQESEGPALKEGEKSPGISQS